MALDRYEALKLKYNSKVEAEYKPYLPIIGNVMPSKSLGKFDNLTEYTYAKSAGASGADSGLNGRRAYRGDYCRNFYIGVAANETATITYTPAAALDIINMADTVDNKFATVKTTGKHLTSGTSYKDLAHLVLNLGYLDAGSGTGAVIGLKLYASSDFSKTATLKTALRKTIDISSPAYAYISNKFQFAIEEDSFDLAGGFTEDDFEAVTKIDFVFYKASSTCYIWLHELSTALPSYEASHCEDSYYPSLTAATSIYVSQIFGLDTNSGETRALPVMTLEKAFTLTTATRVNIIILDSAVYKPAATDYTSIGLKPVLTDNVSVYADYLETPAISAEAGHMDNNRVGARLLNRNRFGDFQYGFALIKTVGASGADYTTISDAYAAASTGDTIEIIDDGTYTEYITKASGDNKNVFIQAAPGKTPEWKAAEISAGVYGMIKCESGSSGKIYCAGIRFVGGAGGVLTDYYVILDEDIEFDFIDCDFTACKRAVLDLNVDFTGVKFINCLFIDNSSTTEMISQAGGISGQVSFINCGVYLNDDYRCILIRARRSNNSDRLSYNFIGCVLKGSQAQTGSYIYEAGDTSAAFDIATELNCYYTIIGARIKVNSSNSFRHTIRLQYNQIRDIKSTHASYKVIELMAANTPNNIVLINSNLFYKVEASAAGSIYAIWADTGAITSWDVSKNIFSNINNYSTNRAYCILRGDDGAMTFTHTGNIFYKCDVPFYYNKTSGDALSVTHCVFVDVNYLAGAGTGGSVTLSTCIVSGYGTAGSNGTVTLATTSWEEDPLFVAPEMLDFGYFPASRLASNSSFAYIDNFIYPSGAHTLNFSFIKFEGTTGKAGVSSSAGAVSCQYCTVNNFSIGFNAVLSAVSALNIKAENNSIFFNANNAVKETLSTLTNCIADRCATGLLLNSAVTFEHNTIVNGGYGIYSKLTGYTTTQHYVNEFIVIADSIIFDNSIYDYYSKHKTAYCIIGTRYFDTLNVLDADYTVTVSPTDITENPFLTEDFYPSLKYLGFKKNSSAYLAASDGDNIGAREQNHIKAVVTYDEYTVPTNSDKSLTGNPQEYMHSLEALNTEEIYTVEGEYQAEYDAFANKYRLAWSDPGRSSKMKATQKAVLELVYKTYWFTAFSIDGGDNWIYAKVIKSASPQFTQANFTRVQLPWSATIEFVELPSFNPTDYEVDTWA